MCSASSSLMNSSLEVSRGESLGESTIDVVEALKKGFDKMMVLSPSKEEHFDFKRDCTDLKENCTYTFMENFEQEDADFFLSLKEEDASAIRCSTPVNGDNNVSVELMDVIVMFRQLHVLTVISLAMFLSSIHTDQMGTPATAAIAVSGMQNLMMNL
ncbi:hypothetical protein D917_09894 [Trichinella nativa]|uniref:Uncharacterized protein n=1 Tax=Trichinella nativa TaxID=6335 RepID=A0A1Y3EDJ5_9BILA|nr:hypothetical protein D917_09894 [Trichinella nativa]